MNEPTEAEDLHFMARALAQAEKGIGLTSPNPPVGAVLVRGGEVLGEGWHRRCGGAHAEVEAIKAAQAGTGGPDLTGSSLYVTLEPCSSEGRTGACTDAIIAAGIREVVIGCEDPDQRHQGRAREVFGAAGVAVRVGVREDECAQLIRGFGKVIGKGLPWVIAKAGMTLDGRITRPEGEGQWITGEAAREDAMNLRVQADAIVVGANTARVDDPRLTLRGEAVPAGKIQPWRVVLGERETLPGELQMFTDAHASRTRVISGDDLEGALREMVSWGVTTVLVEGGGGILGSFFAARLVDEVVFYVAPKIGLEGIQVTGENRSGSSVDLRFCEISRVGEDLRIRALLP